MKNHLLKKVFSVIAAVALCCSSAVSLADVTTVEVDGTVINTMEIPITATYSGVIDTLSVCEGDWVKKGDTIATLKTTKVYATVDGTVRLFGSIGDSASIITEHYGAVAYIEPDVQYTISASTRNAYDLAENKVIHPGEKVYLRGASSTSHVGTGTVTQFSGTTFTVDIDEGNFENSESINVYRDSEYNYLQRIGRGSSSRVEYTAYAGSGIIVSYCSADGAKVKKGDVLFETIEGDFAGYETDLTAIKAPADGVINTLSVSLGSSVTSGDSVCTLYPDDAMRVEASVSEENLSALQVETAVHVHFTYWNGGDSIVNGIVEKVSETGADDETDESDEAFFKAVIRLEDNAFVKYGMTVTVTD